LTRQKDIYSDIYSFSKKKQQADSVLSAGSAGEGVANGDGDYNDDDDDDDNNNNDGGGDDDSDCDGDGRAPRGGSGARRRRWGQQISSIVIRGVYVFLIIYVNYTIILEYTEFLCM
jgi:hypothetical protein